MKLKPFTIITHNESLQVDEETLMLINLEHIISVKPIKISTKTRDIIEGHWIRLSNGKKYRVIQVPAIIIDAFNEVLPGIRKNKDAEQEVTYQ
jgi:hypothetical protein